MRLTRLRTSARSHNRLGTIAVGSVLRHLSGGGWTLADTALGHSGEELSGLVRDLRILLRPD